MQLYFLGFIVLLYFFVIIFQKKNPVYLFFSLIIFGIIIYNIHDQYINKTNKDDHIIKYIKNIEKQCNFELLSKDYHIHKIPIKLEHLLMNKDFMNILWDLKFIYIYDRHALIRLACYFEIFLKMHYNMLIGKYEYILYYPKLIDLHKEISNHIKSFTFNVPNISTVLDIENIDDVLEEKYKRTNALTFKYTKIIYKKYKTRTNTYIYKGPSPIDLQMSENYSLL